MVEFKGDPPNLRRGRVSDFWASTVEELRAKPGEFGLIGTYSPSVATGIKEGRYPAFCPDPQASEEERKAYVKANFEVTTTNTDDDSGRRDLWIKFIGKPDA